MGRRKPWGCSWRSWKIVRKVRVFWWFVEISLNIVEIDIGQVTEVDIKKAKQYNAKILTMDTVVSVEAFKMAQEDKIDIKQYKIIYALTDDVLNLIHDRENEGKVDEEIRG